MNDRELLGLAAKAAGVDPALIEIDGQVVGYDVNGEPIITKGWNALADDGDAFRLAVRLNLLDGLERRASELAAEVNYDMDPCEATRRAIVRVAAGIGGAQ